MDGFTDIRKPCIYPFAIFVIIFLSICGSSAWAQNRTYLQVTGQEQTQFRWHIEKQNDASTELTVTNGSNKTVYTSKNNVYLEATQWHLKNSSATTNFTASRQKNSIFVKGTLNGKPCNGTLSIDAEPWLQPMSFSLAHFVQSESPTITFWTVNPDSLKPFKMKAVKVKTETLTINGKETPAQKVKVSLVGLRAAFWEAYYWFSADNGTFIRYEGIDGPPGTPLTVTTLIEA